MTRDEIKTIRDEMNTALSTLEAKYNIKFEIGTISYDETGFRAPVKATSVSDINDPEAVKRIEYVKHCHKFGLEKDWFGKDFSTFGKTYRIAGVLPKGRKYTVLAWDYSRNVYVKMVCGEVIRNMKMVA